MLHFCSQVKAQYGQMMTRVEKFSRITHTVPQGSTVLSFLLLKHTEQTNTCIFLSVVCQWALKKIKIVIQHHT